MCKFNILLNKNITENKNQKDFIIYPEVGPLPKALDALSPAGVDILLGLVPGSSRLFDF